MPLPRIGVAQTKFYEGLVSLRQTSAQYLTCVTLEELLNTSWPTDAHFVTYSLVTDDEAWPRFTKEVLPEIRAAGAQLVSQYVVLDYDNADHAPWTTEMLNAFELQLLEAATKGLTLLNQVAAFYTTKQGARFIFILDHAIDVEELEQFGGMVRAEFARFGIAVDDSCKDWTRMWRAPRVNREGQRTDLHPYFQLDADLSKRLTVPKLQKAQAQHSAPDPKLTAAVQSENVTIGKAVREWEEPTSDDIESLLYTKGATGNLIMTHWYKRMRTVLKDRECFRACFEKMPIASQGSRNSTIFSFAGQVVSASFQIPGSTVQQAYALLFDSVNKLEGLDAGKPWTDTLWRAIVTSWVRETTKQEVRKRQLEVEQSQRDVAVKTCIRGMKTWCNHPALYKEDAEALAFVAHHALAILPDGRIHVLQPNGYYDPIAVSPSHIIARIRELKMDKVVSCYSAEGRELISTQLINEHGTIISQIEGSVNKKGHHIIGIGSPNATLVMNLYELNTNIRGKYHSEVATWLAAVGGARHTEKLNDWLGHALDFSRPICALSVNGPPNIGKKLLVQGIAENINTEVVADIREMVGRFQYDILRSPFLVCNEGFPRADRAGMRDPADSFRHFISGDPITVEQKFKGTVTIRTPMRIMVLANNSSVLASLYKYRNLSPEDRDALAVRLFHIDASSEAANYLRRLGGISYTGQHGARWIKGDDGSPSNYIVAEHFRWLYENRREVKKGQRLLVEGDLSEPVVRMMSVGSSMAPEVIETILRMVESKTELSGITWNEETKTLYLTTSGVVEYVRNSGKYTKLDVSGVAFVIRGIAAHDWTDGKTMTLKNKGYPRKARWYALDLDLLHEQAILHGYPCVKLEEYKQKQAQTA